MLLGSGGSPHNARSWNRLTVVDLEILKNRAAAREGRQRATGWGWSPGGGPGTRGDDSGVQPSLKNTDFSNQAGGRGVWQTLVVANIL